jgi:hypothetical protein
LGWDVHPILSDDLIHVLNQRGVHFLYQARSLPRLGLFGHNWLTCSDLNIGGTLAAEWQDYRKLLISSGIQLTQRPDELNWLGGDRSGRITVKNAMRPSK